MEKTEEDLNLCFLLEDERNMILRVLQKDEKLRKQEEKRIRRLKNEFLEIKMRGSQRNQEAGERECARCLRTLGLIFDRGDLCEDCHLRVCNQCRVNLPKGRQWKCNVCAKISELKVVTGEWFLEERSKRFEQCTVLGDVIKQTILNSPTATKDMSPERGSTPEKPVQSETSGTPKSTKSSIHSLMDGAKRKGLRMDKRKPGNRVKAGSLHSLLDDDTPSVQSMHSDPSPHSHRGSGALEPSGRPVVPNNLRPIVPSDQSSLPGDSRRFRPDGAESVSSFQSADSMLEKLPVGHPRAESATPTIAVSRASGSSVLPSLRADHSRSELDLSVPRSEASDDSFSLRSRSIPGLNGSEYSDGAEEEDIDALVSAGRGVSQRLSNAVSASSTPGSERRWGYLNVPDSDAETSSINSMMSMYSETGDYGNARVSGEILLKISYSYKTGALNVLVKECHNLATGDEKRQRTDAKRKTSIKSNSSNPVFNENLRYTISHSQLETRTLQLSVWHHDRFRQNTFLGEVELTFDSWEFDSKIEEWYALQPKVDNSIDSTMQYKGELTVVLKYIPAEKNLTLPLDQVHGKNLTLPLDQVHVNKKSFLKGKKTSSFTLPKGGMVELLVKEAKNLTAVKSGGTSDPFVKGYLLPDSNKSTKHKTAVERRTVNPRWNHTFTYCGLQPGDLDNVCLELTVWDKEALASNVFLGGVRLGAGTGNSYGNDVDWMDSYGEEQQLWQRMVENPEVPQECTLMLRSSMGKTDT
ncbi:Synaptotagmin-like protein 5 [Merluccius polli]|uniref:Synaptotagmin-like protein 5 n=1 Tax=Merluccius polli TaxID=89951 RepID=A0AA47MIN7_MERPO|nr:Synaptotagmin-like protein 5 [Merluccius polli]